MKEGDRCIHFLPLQATNRGGDADHRESVALGAFQIYVEPEVEGKGQIRSSDQTSSLKIATWPHPVYSRILEGIRTPVWGSDALGVGCE